MAGGVFAFVVLMIILLCVGFFGIAAGIVGLILFNKARKKGKKFGKPLIAVSAVVLALSVLITVLPVGWGVFLFKVNTDIPDDYVETEIVIEENGYQEKAFTANGVKYECVEIEDVVACGEEYFSNPIFSYRTENFADRDLWGNYYKIENENGFNIVAGMFGQFFCPVDEKEKVTAFYNDDNNFAWWLCDNEYNQEKKVGHDGQKVLDELYKISDSKPDTILKVVDWGTQEDYVFDFISEDNLFIKSQSISIWKIEGKYYLQISAVSNTGENHFLEVVEIDSESAEKLIESIK